MRKARTGTQNHVRMRLKFDSRLARETANLFGMSIFRGSNTGSTKIVDFGLFLAFFGTIIVVIGTH